MNKPTAIAIFLITLAFGWLILNKGYEYGKRNVDIEELCKLSGGTPMTRRLTEKSGEFVCFFTTK